jgi:hypothetical protein
VRQRSHSEIQERGIRVKTISISYPSHALHQRGTFTSHTGVTPHFGNMIPYSELENENKRLKKEAQKNQRLHSIQTKMLTEELVDAKLRLKIIEKETDLLSTNDIKDEYLIQVYNVERYGSFVGLLSRLYPVEYHLTVKEFNT